MKRKLRYFTGASIPAVKRTDEPPRRKIQNARAQYIVGCYSRGVIFSEHLVLTAAQRSIGDHPGLLVDGYAIYTRKEWIGEWATVLNSTSGESA